MMEKHSLGADSKTHMGASALLKRILSQVIVFQLLPPLFR